MYDSLIKITDKIGLVFSSVTGWLTAVVIAFVNFLGDEKMAFGVVGIALLADMVLGIWAALKEKKFIFSHLGRETFKKALIYLITLILILMIERSLHDDNFIATKIACAIASSCELFSVFANALIIKPDFPFVKLFKKYLAGEISRKIGVNAEEYLEENKNQKTEKKNETDD